MRVARLELQNWARFAGRVVVECPPGVTAVVARYVDDRARSNWGGKSVLLEAIRFALFGVHRWRRDDEWITAGAGSGSVGLELTGGMGIRRARSRGSATSIAVVSEGAERSGARAAAALQAALGLDGDYFSTCWIGQKQAARLVVARPAERFALVAQWAGIEALRKCEESARDMGRAVAAEVAGLSAQLQAQRALVVECDWSAELAYARAAARVAREKLHAYELHTEAAKPRKAMARAAADMQAELAGLKREYDQIGVVAEPDSRAWEAATLGLREVDAQLARLAAIRSGGFDGACPVVPGLECPARKVVDAAARDRTEARAELGARQAMLREAERVEGLAVSTARRAVARRAALVQARDAIVPRLRAMLAEMPAPPVEEYVTGAGGELAAAAERATREEARLRAAREASDRAAARAAELEAELVAVKARLAAVQGAAQVVGRQGAQRVLAQRALEAIEHGANVLLGESGIDLSVSLSWSRDASDQLAPVCACGYQYSGQREKRCPECREPRGPKQIDALDVELSDRSGAAEDLAGIALQLGAAAWLREEHAIPWSVAVIDEPFGALDERNRRQFSAHLASMLASRYGIEQAFVIAHSSDVVDALPNRIQIVADATRSWVE